MSDPKTVLAHARVARDQAIQTVRQQPRADQQNERDGRGFWSLTRYEDVSSVLRDPRFIKEPLAALVAARFGAEVPRGVGLSMLDRDPPDHTRLRSLVSKAFTPRVVEGLRPRIQRIVDELITRAEAAGSMDVIEEFAYPIPVNVICEMLGVPVAAMLMSMLDIYKRRYELTPETEARVAALVEPRIHDDDEDVAAGDEPEDAPARS